MKIRKREREIDMRKSKITFTAEEKQEIQAALEQQQTPHVYKRLLVLKMRAINGKESREIADTTELCVTSVNRILLRYKEQGLEAIVSKRHNHGKRYMTSEEEVEFLNTFAEKAQAGQVIEVTDIHNAYQLAVGHDVTRNAIYYLLHKHNWRKVMPRSRHPKKASEAEIEAFQKNIGQDPKGSPKPEELSGDVSGRGWIWAHQ